MPYSHAMYGYAGYAKHGYVTWLYHCDHVGYAKMWLRHMVMPYEVTPVTPNSVTSHDYATYRVRRG